MLNRAFTSSFARSMHSFIEAASPTARARADLIQFESVAEQRGGEYPVVLLQAVPLEPLREPWAVLEPPMWEPVRQQFSQDFPEPTSEGVEWAWSEDTMQRWVALHRSGYVGAAIVIKPFPPGETKPLLAGPDFTFAMEAAAAFDSLLQNRGLAEHPYLFRLKLLRALGTVLEGYTLALADRPEILLERERRDRESLLAIADELCQRLVYAFGVRKLRKRLWQRPSEFRGSEAQPDFVPGRA